MGLDFIPTGIATGVTGSIFAAQVVQAVAALNRWVVPAGVFWAYAVGANLRLQIQDSAGAWNNITAAGVIPGLVASDGTNIAVYNEHAADSQNVTYIKIG